MKFCGILCAVTKLDQKNAEMLYSESSKHDLSDVKVVYQFFCFLHPFAFIQLNIYLIDIKFATLILLSCCPNNGSLRLCYLYKQS